MKVNKPLFILAILLLLQSCTSQTKKINEVSFVAAREAVAGDHVAPVATIHANYAAVMPFGFIRDLAHPEVVFNTERQWFGETKEGVKQYIGELRKKKIDIMIKPQIWVWRGEFTGYIEMKNEADWKTLETSYSKFILEYAELARDENAEIFCIGTELEKFIANRPDYWFKLINEVKQIYKGKLTYAANWDEFKRTPFWEVLDFIGIDAYFPVSKSKTPTVEACLAGWEPYKKVIRNLSETYGKPVLFMEFGYRSVDYSGKEPWKSDRDMGVVNLDAQNNTTKALFGAFWKEDWFAGGFIWKWFHNHSKAGGENNSQFTPQNKPVEELIKTYYAIHK